MNRAGRFDQSITIQQQSVARDSLNAEIVSWVTFKALRAEVNDLSGREYLAAQARTAQRTVRVVIRYVDGVTAKMRILHGTRTYQIDSVLVETRRRSTITLMCTDTNGATS